MNKRIKNERILTASSLFADQCSQHDVLTSNSIEWLPKQIVLIKGHDTDSGGGGIGLIFAGYVPLVTFGQICNFCDPNLVTFYFYELTHFF